jgi:ATP-dependent DNA ligase
MISKAGQDLARYFPEVVAEALALSERHFLLDGELVVPNSKHFSFDRLLQRIHPATSRIKKLSHDTPALFIAFDLLSRGNRRLDRANLDERREVLKNSPTRIFAARGFACRRPAANSRWLAAMAAGRGERQRWRHRQAA